MYEWRKEILSEKLYIKDSWMESQGFYHASLTTSRSATERISVTKTHVQKRKKEKKEGKPISNLFDGSWRKVKNISWKMEYEKEKEKFNKFSIRKCWQISFFVFNIIVSPPPFMPN